MSNEAATGYVSNATQGDIYRKQGRESEAGQATQKAIDLAPDDWRWHNQLGVYYLQTASSAKAVGQFQEVVRLTPDNSFGYLNLGIALKGAQRFAEAEKAFTQAIAIRKTFSAYLNLSTVFSLEGKNRDAVEAARRATELNPSYYLAWGSLGSAWSFNPKGREQALEAYKQAILRGEKARAANPKDAQVVANLASYYAFEKDASRSVPLLRQALALGPNDPGILFLAGEAFEMLGRRDEALHWVGEALRLGYSADVVKRSPGVSRVAGGSAMSITCCELKKHKSKSLYTNQAEETSGSY